LNTASMYGLPSESLYTILMVSPNGRPPNDSCGLKLYSKEAYKTNKI